MRFYLGKNAGSSFARSSRVSELCVAAMGLAFFVRSSAAHFLFYGKEGIAVFVPEDLDEIIQRLRRNDAQCRELLEKSYVLSEQYFRILDSLEPDDKACLQQHQGLCEDLEDRTVQLIAAHYAIHGTMVLKDSEL